MVPHTLVRFRCIRAGIPVCCFTRGFKLRHNDMAAPQAMIGCAKQEPAQTRSEPYSDGSLNNASWPPMVAAGQLSAAYTVKGAAGKSVSRDLPAWQIIRCPAWGG